MSKFSVALTLGSQTYGVMANSQPSLPAPDWPALALALALAKANRAVVEMENASNFIKVPVGASERGCLEGNLISMPRTRRSIS